MGRREIRKPKQKNKETEIRKGVAEIQDDDFENRTYKLSFDYYDEKLCEFSAMRSGDCRKVLSSCRTFVGVKRGKK